MQLRALFEVGVGELYWLNEVVAVGVLSNVDGGEEVEEGTFWLRIDVWHVSFCLLFGLGRGGFANVCWWVS